MHHPALAVLVPVLKRPHRVAPLVESIVSTTPQPVTIYFIVDPDDWREKAAIGSVGFAVTLELQGSYAEKINYAIRMTDEQLVALVADDVDFQPGWLEAALAKMTGDTQVVGVNDLRPRDWETATHFLMTRTYAEQPTIDGGPGPLCVDYSHNFVDRELIETARKRGVYAFAEDACVEHLHHLDGRAEYDDTYRKGEHYFRHDARRFRRRAHLWQT